MCLCPRSFLKIQVSDAHTYTRTTLSSHTHTRTHRARGRAARQKTQTHKLSHTPKLTPKREHKSYAKKKPRNQFANNNNRRLKRDSQEREGNRLGYVMSLKDPVPTAVKYTFTNEFLRH